MADESFVSSSMIGVEEQKASQPSSITVPKVTIPGRPLAKPRSESTYVRPLEVIPDTTSPVDIRKAPYSYQHPAGFTSLPPEGEDCLPIPYSLVVKGQFCQWDYKPYHFFCEIKPHPAAPVKNDFLVWVRKKDITEEQAQLMQSDWGKESISKYRPFITKKETATA